MAKHTPGPWRVEGRRGPGYIISAGVNAEGDGPAEYVGVIAPMFHVAGDGSDRHAADARLIASAPALLEALTRALPYVETAEADEAYKPGEVAKVTAMIRAAIRQAERGE